MATETMQNTRILKTTDSTVSMRHIANHVYALRNNIESDSKHSNPKAYVDELDKVIVSVKSTIGDIAYIMRRKGMKVSENVDESGKNITLKEAKSKVFHYFSKTDFDTATKVRFYLNCSNNQNIEKLFSEEELQLQYNILKQCMFDAYAAKILYEEAASA